MKIPAALFLAILLLPLVVRAADGPPHGHMSREGGSAAGASEGDFKPTEKEAFRLRIGVRELKQGPNGFDLTVRDREGKEVEGATVTVTPWMPEMGHGVWEKPVVTDRGRGSYRVDNVMIIMEGRWEIRVTVRKGGIEDTGVFTFGVSEKRQPVPSDSGGRNRSYERTVKYYNVPNVTLLDQDGKKVNLRSLIDSGKPVIIDFIFTTCTTICPVLSAGFSNFRTELGENAGKVQLISITIDPEHDRPERMKQYLSRFNWGPGWEFLTGSREDVGRVLKAFDAFIVDKMSHEPLYILRGADSEEWVRIKGLIGKSDLMNEFRRIEKR